MKRQPLIPEEILRACIPQLPERAVRKLLGLLADEEIAVVRGPLTGLVMMTARDSVDADFYLGEVLVTEVEVAYRGCRGYGMVVGDDAERALARASVDAVDAADNGPLRERINRLLAAESKKIDAQRVREAAILAGTRVNFETMKRT